MIKRAIPVVAVMAVAVAGCGGSSSSGSSTTHTSAASGVKVAVHKVSFGTALVGPNGHTVYLFMKDRGAKSSCVGKCAGVWSPLVTSGQPQAGSGVTASMLGTTTRTDGTTQVTYGGHPLYYYEDDKRPGTAEGEGSKEFGAEWYAVGTNGNKLEQKGS